MKFSGIFRRVSRRVKQDLAYYRRLFSHPRTPRLAKWLLGAAIAYILTPIDLIPDFIPVLGQLDDWLIAPALVWAALLVIPKDVREACRQDPSASS